MSETVLGSIRVMCVTAHDGLQGISRVWSELESKLPSLKNRRFYGVYHPSSGIYRACVATKPDNQSETLGLEVWTIPGEKYARRTLPDWEQHKDRIAPLFEEMSRQYSTDSSRPSIEFYRSQRELILYLPIK